MSAPTATRLLSQRPAATTVARIIGLEELAGIIGLALVAAFFRPQGVQVSWQVPGATWLLLTIGLGTTVGLIVYAMLQRRSEGPDFLVLTIGSISFAAGAAGYLYLSSVVVAFMAGILLANLGGTYHTRLRDMLLRLERPIYLISLVIIGALWRLDDARAWLLIPVFAAARLAGKWLAIRLALRRDEPGLGPSEQRALAVSPLGALSIAIVINAQLLYPGGSISMIASAVVGGALLTETLVQLAGRRSRPITRSRRA
jgi:Kef-type K+ transport system membrane component KefB